MPPAIHITHTTALLTAVVRERVAAPDLSRFVPAACGEVWAFARAAGLPKPGRHVALYLDTGLVEVGVEVTAAFTGNDRIHCSRLPAGRVAHAVHLGPYDRLGDAHAALRQWCAVHGHACTGTTWELYAHWQEDWSAHPAQIRTDVFHLLADTGAE